MRCEVVAVGTELLLGQIVDTNSSWIGEQLALVGIDSHFQVKVGDNWERIKSTLEAALDRSDAVIVCGGLGPTQDDITRDVIADLMGVPLERNEALVEKIRNIFGGRGRPMPENNLRQADVPRGAAIIPQMPGTAPGLICPIGDKVIYAVPGVPYEMEEMVGATVLPDLERRAGIKGVIKSRTLRTWGDSESGLAQKLHEEFERLERDGGCTIAFLASGMEGIKVRLTAKAENETAVDAILSAEETRVRAIIGPVVFGMDDDNMESVVLDLLIEQGLTLGLAESLTGGMISARLCDIPGASKAFRGSIVSYASDVKFDLLGVPEGPVISEAAVTAMVQGACRVLGTDVGIAVTGVAGPDPQDGEEPGTVWMATLVDGEVVTQRSKFPFDRNRTRQFTTISVLNSLRMRLLARRGG
ncbi:MAG: competence/damage-inducible protein A [Acidimicrobiales bacterium]